ncbi:unnamed protein product, partial [Prorocentrum cordatum]
RQRIGICSGIGALLCWRGGDLCYTPIFIPLLRVCDAADMDALMDHTAAVVRSAMSSPLPKDVHPALWHAARTVADDVTRRVLNMNVLLKVFCSGAVVCAARWLEQSPSSSRAMDSLHPVLHGARVRGLAACGQVSRQIFSMLMAPSGAPASAYPTVNVVASQLPVWFMATYLRYYDQVAALMVNSLLGVELLQRAARDALGDSAPPVALGAVDVACAGLGVCCFARQLWGSYSADILWARSCCSKLYERAERLVRAP